MVISVCDDSSRPEADNTRGRIRYPSHALGDGAYAVRFEPAGFAGARFQRYALGAEPHIASCMLRGLAAGEALPVGRRTVCDVVD